MTARDDFPLSVKKALAERVGYRCSFPGCGALTIGPSEESSIAISNVGMACHISAASAGTGARRYVADMTSEMRMSIDNGIWMCYTHGKLIDTDEERFTINMLQKWRQLAELRARLSLETGTYEAIATADLSELDLAAMSITLESMGAENSLIGNALRDSCVPLLWGEAECHAIRDVLIELVRNAFIHGAATSCSLRISQSTIQLQDDGNEFDSLRLRLNKRRTGGAAAVRHLMEKFASSLVITSRRLDNTNENETLISFVRTVEDFSKISPCVISWTDELRHSLERKVYYQSDSPDYDITDLNACQMIYIMVPDYFALSDERFVAELVSQLAAKGKQVALVVSDISDLAVEWLQQILYVRVIQIPPRR